MIKLPNSDEDPNRIDAIHNELLLLEAQQVGLNKMLAPSPDGGKQLPVWGFDQKQKGHLLLTGSPFFNLDDAYCDQGIISASRSLLRLSDFGNRVFIGRGVFSIALLIGLGFEAAGLLCTDLPTNCEQLFKDRRVSIIDGPRINPNQITRAFGNVNAKVNVCSLPELSDHQNVTREQLVASINRAIKI